MSSAMRKVIPPSLRKLITSSPLYIQHQSAYANIFHCCIWKTGSRWIRKILADRRTFRRSGLRTFSYHAELPGGADYRPLNERSFETPFPIRTIVTPLYIDYENYGAIPKSGPSRAFFVIRDPRDVLVSWYFSIKHSHPSVGVVEGVRDELQRRNTRDGLLYCIDALEDKGVFPALRSWSLASSDEDVRLIRFEDLVGSDAVRIFRSLFQHCDIAMSELPLRRLLDDYSFERLSGGRKPGNENVASNYRKGVPGDWRNLFDASIQRTFDEVTRGLAGDLGYAE